jgi:V8-like Glu-specific endopeptidase
MGLRTRPLRLPRHYWLSIGGAFLASAGLVALGIPASSVPADEVTRRVDESVLRPTAVSASGKAFTGVPAVGALFPAGAAATSASAPGSAAASAAVAAGDTAGRHFCTASVVHSPAGDLAVTAAHCVSGHSTPIVFVPGFHDGQAPYGTWQVTRVYTDQAWQASQDPDDDVAFLQLSLTADGEAVEAVTGSEHLDAPDGRGADVATPRLVQVIGYPQATDQPVLCVNWAHAFTITQREFDCGGYPDGTSGGPFLADVDPVSGQGTVIGVIGGYQLGGDTDAVSYAAVFGPNVATLYQVAVSGG